MSISARMIGAGKPNTSVSTFRTSVLRMARENSAIAKILLKFRKPVHVLALTPVKML